MDEGSHPHPHPHPHPLSHGAGGQQSHPRMPSARGSSTAGSGGGGGGFNNNIQNEIMWIKQDAAQVRNAVILLEQEKDSLRKAIRKLKLEDGRMKQKLKTLQETVSKLSGESKENGEANGPSEADLDYDDIGRDFFLIGGIHDPLSLRHEVPIRDNNGVEHKSAERYYWYKMAETFDDKEAMKKILQAPNVNAAEEAMKEIKDFNEKEWDKLKLKFWEEGQRMKMEQVRGIANLLVFSKTTYLAVASQDKCFGTGWRKNREESNKPIFWDGLNEGGKILMKLRQELKMRHVWAGPHEEEETAHKFRDCQRFVWRRIDPTKRLLMGGMGRGGGPVHYRGGGGRGGMIRRGYNGTGPRYGSGPSTRA